MLEYALALREQRLDREKARGPVRLFGRAVAYGLALVAAVYMLGS